MIRILLAALRPILGAQAGPADGALLHRIRGLELLAHQRYDDAVVEFQEAVRLAPHDADARFELGVAYWELRRWEACAREWDEALRLHPEHLPALQRLGAARRRVAEEQAGAAEKGPAAGLSATGQ